MTAGLGRPAGRAPVRLHPLLGLEGIGAGPAAAGGPRACPRRAGTVAVRAVADGAGTPAGNAPPALADHRGPVLVGTELWATARGAAATCRPSSGRPAGALRYGCRTDLTAARSTLGCLILSGAGVRAVSPLDPHLGERFDEVLRPVDPMPWVPPLRASCRSG